MSEQEIVEGNKLIAKFMGYQVLSKKYETRHWVSSGEYDWVIEEGEIVCDSNGNEVDDDKNEPYFYLEDLPFHLSCDWLMPVVEKIGNLNSLEKDGEWFNFVIQNGKVPTNTYYTHIGRVGEYSRNLGNISSGKSSSLIESNWLCVVEFIKWYNSCQTKK